jgi:pimeloyl-ACP methyl ester carboxylesterase
VALEYAARYPAHVAGLILCNTGPTYRHMDRIVARLHARATAGQFAEIMAWLAAVPERDEDFAACVQSLLPFYVQQPSAALLHALFGAVQFRSAAFRHGLGMVADYDMTERLAPLTTPALVIGADHDLIFAVDEGPAVLAARLPRAELVVFEACGHYPFAEQPDRFHAVVDEWLARQVLQSP